MNNLSRLQDAKFSDVAYYAFYPAVTMAVGRRPYVRESEGVVYLTTDFLTSFSSHDDIQCDVRAKVGNTSIDNGQWKVGNQENAEFKFELAFLPVRVDDGLEIVLDCFYSQNSSSSFRIKKVRRFQRFAASEAPYSYSQVDHSNKGMRMGGKPFIGNGYYMSMFPPSGA